MKIKSFSGIKKLINSMRMHLLEECIKNNFEILLFIIMICYKSIIFNKLINIGCGNLRMIASSLGAALFFAGLSVFFKRRTRAAVLLFLDLLLSIIMVADLVYFRYFDDVISAPVLRQVVLMDGALKSSIFSLFRLSDLYFVFDIIICIPLFAILFKRSTTAACSHIKVRAAEAALAMVVGISLVTSGFIAAGKLGGKKIFSFVFDRSFFVYNLGILNYHGFDLYTAAVDAFADGNAISDEEKNKIRDEIKTFTDMDKGDYLKGAAKGCNLIVIQAEAFQSMLINMKVNGNEVTPNMNRFIKRSVYFDSFFSQVGQGNTSDAEFLANVSYYPLPEGAVYFRNATNKYESLPWLLKEKGYKTIAMHAYKGSYWNRSSIYPVLGFDEFVNMDDFVFEERLGWGLSDKSFYRQSVERLKKLEEPFYAFMVSLSAHHPYSAFENYEEFDAGTYNHTFFGNYLKAQHYADQAFGVLFDALEKSGLMDNSIVVIYGDHAGIQRDKIKDINEFVAITSSNDLAWLEMKRVPLIIHFPKDREAGLRNLTGGQVDLFPTLANLFDLHPKYALGKDLFNTDYGYAVFRDGSVTDGKTIYVANSDKCFDIRSGNPVEADKHKDIIEMAIQQLYISDKVISNNLIAQYEKLNGK